MVNVAVLGQIARDLVLVVPEIPDAGAGTAVRERHEMLGGKGANIAVAVAQLGMPVWLLGVVGADEVGDRLVVRARSDRIDTTFVVRRPGARTALIVEVLCGGKWRYLEDLPPEVRLSAADVAAAAPALRAASSVIVQLQQPSEAALAAAARARSAGTRVVLDGAPADDDRRDALLAAADVLRTDHHEAELLAGRGIDGPDAALRTGRELLARGPSLVAIAVDPIGNMFVWDDRHLLIPHGDERVVDTTGAGDSLVAALTVALTRGEPVERAARLAVAAAGSTVAHVGGRPALNPRRLTGGKTRPG